MGLLCYLKLEGVENISESPLIIIIPKDYCDIEKYKNGDKINTEVVDLRIKYMSRQIKLIAKIAD